jgi:hypothetical protein
MCVLPTRFAIDYKNQGFSMKNVRWWVMCGVLPILAACGGGDNVRCNLLGGAACNSPDPVVNLAPVAHAGANQSVLLDRTPVTLNASGSTDANGDLLKYEWVMLSKPFRSIAALNNDVLVMPTFTPDVNGTYVFSLVVSDSKLSSGVSLVTVTASEVNARPVASAGVDQSVMVNALVTLDGRDSSDANRDDELTFTWSLVRPDGTSQVLTGVRPTFNAALTGNYTASLTVRDAESSSDPDAVLVVVSAVNAPPVAVIDTPASVVVGNAVQLSAANSTDVNQDPLNYKWSLLSKPMKSTGALADSSASLLAMQTLVNPVFTADVPGVYVISLVANDTKENSDPVTVAVIASAQNLPPVANAGPDQVVAVDSTVTLDGRGSTDPNLDILDYRWTWSSRPTGSNALLVNSLSARPTFTPDLPGFYVVTLSVDDNKDGSHVSRVLIKAE